ncbi:hypothetical protein JTE90_028586 [Oedothorax gibbosus]|uniref:Uncharacterized protein n=1 Tax=Oedothorax gibbosus TaxID=931172 RepID=A0AAV6TZ86_9ARAC|nr:hypothetical protein JTE90_028586 [Oedothorax gibbosus]
MKADLEEKKKSIKDLEVKALATSKDKKEVGKSALSLFKEANERLKQGIKDNDLNSVRVAQDLPAPLSRKSYNVIVDQLLTTSKDVAANSMKQAALAEMELTKNRNITVSGDGTWKTRGHNLNNWRLQPSLETLTGIVILTLLTPMAMNTNYPI